MGGAVLHCRQVRAYISACIRRIAAQRRCSGVPGESGLRISSYADTSAINDNKSSFTIHYQAKCSTASNVAVQHRWLARKCIEGGSLMFWFLSTAASFCLALLFVVRNACSDNTAHSNCLQSSNELCGRRSGVVVAIALGVQVSSESLTGATTTERARALAELVWAPFITRYQYEHHIDANADEIDVYCRRFCLCPEDERDREIACRAVIQWKTDRLLYLQYGGIVVFQQLNPTEPVGAYRAFLREITDGGEFRILDASLESEFWRAIDPLPGWIVPSEHVDYSEPWWVALPNCGLAGR